MTKGSGANIPGTSTYPWIEWLRLYKFLFRQNQLCVFQTEDYHERFTALDRSFTDRRRSFGSDMAPPLSASSKSWPRPGAQDTRSLRGAAKSHESLVHRRGWVRHLDDFQGPVSEWGSGVGLTQGQIVENRL